MSVFGCFLGFFGSSNLISYTRGRRYGLEYSMRSDVGNILLRSSLPLPSLSLDRSLLSAKRLLLASDA